MKKLKPKGPKVNIKKYKSSKKYKKVHVIINPASGKNEPIINVINSVFSEHEVEWSIDVTKKFGDAKKMTKRAVSRGVDLIAGYGGDGTQHEIVNGVMGTGMPIAILPGGTGNGFAAGLGLPDTLKESLEVICTSKSVAKVDVVEVGNKFFMSRMYTGIEPEEQTSRADKNKYGVFAYAKSAVGRSKKKGSKVVKYTLTIDGKKHEVEGLKCYVVNSGSTGMHIPIGKFDPTDGVLDMFIIGKDLKSIAAAGERFLRVKSEVAGFDYWTGKKISIKASPSQPIWADGEFIGRTPVDIKIMTKALRVVVPD